MRLFVLSSILAFFLLGAVPAAAMHRQSRQLPPGVVVLAGQVSSVNGRPAAPTGFDLQLPQRTVSIKIGPRTKFTARSAEALVDGFSPNDFAIVRADKSAQGLTAVHVAYDVVPFGIIHRFTVSGTLVRVALTDRSVQVRLTNGTLHWIAITPQSQILLNGVPIATIPSNSGETLQVTVTVRRTVVRWIALELSLQVASF